jgi:hypothetical protein
MQVFVSHAGPDRAWAEWAAWHLRDAGHAVTLDTWDWAAGDNFVAKMRDALDAADCVLALFSAAYFEAQRYTTEEWTSALVREADGSHRLVPVRIDDAAVPRLLRPLLAPSLFGLPEGSARQALVSAVGGPSGPGDTPPHFPGATQEPVLPGPRVPGALPRSWNVPPRNPSFVGRDGMLVRLREQLLTGGTARVQVLHGMGGVGKTQLLVEYTHRFAGDYDLAWWIRADQPELIGEQLAAAAADVGVAEAGAETALAVRALIRHLRAVGRWLLVFDNAENPSELRSWLPDGPGHVLISTRSTGWNEIAHPMAVDQFARRESVALLCRQVPQLTAQGADRLAEALVDLPLAVAQAAAILTETGMPVDEYLELLETQAARVLDDGRPVSYPTSLAATVALSTADLEAQEPAGAQLLRLCAFLGAAPIPLSLFPSAAARLAEPLSSIVRQRLALRLVVRRIGRYGLARVDPDGLQLHPLVQAVLRGQLSESQRADLRRTSHQVLVAAPPGPPDDPASWQDWARLLPHLLVAVPFAAQEADVRALILSAGRYLLVRGDSQAGLEVAEQILAQWRSVLGEEHPHTLTAAIRVAHGLVNLGRYSEALTHHEWVLRTRQRLLGDDHPETLQAANGVAVTLRRLGAADRARVLNEQTLERRRRILGPHHVETLLSATNLAADLRTLGDVEPAARLHEDTFRRYCDVLGEDHPDTLRSAHNLAADLRKLGQADQARELEEQTYDRRRTVLGEDHPDTLSSALQLIDDLQAAGNRAAARDLAARTLPRSRKVFGDDHANTARCAATLAAADPAS